MKVPKKNLVGTLNDGWTIAKYLLTHERQMIGGIGETDKKKSLSEIAIDVLGKTKVFCQILLLDLKFQIWR